MTSTVNSIATVCVHCGGREADAQTGRCLKCGKVAISPQIMDEFAHPFERRSGESRHSPSAAYRTSHDEEPAPPKDAPPAASPTTPTPESAGSTASATEPAEADRELREYFEQKPSLGFVLPDSRETTSWLAKTKAVRDQLLARADKAEAQIAELRAEAERCRQTAEAFTSLLSQLSVAGESETPPVSNASPALKPTGKWSKHSEACTDCGRSDVPHCANGRCRACDSKWRNPPKGARV